MTTFARDSRSACTRKPPLLAPLTFLDIDTPETENHLLMIESSRYLFNQLRADKNPGDVTFDNTENKLRKWILNYMQRVTKHDFLEFNSRPYQRMSLHALLNLYEFALDDDIMTAAQILLDYTMLKFALSSNRCRRVAPFRRHQHAITHQANSTNYLYAAEGDQVNGFFLAYVGWQDAGLKPGPLPPPHDFAMLLAATSTYRPPPAAYELALVHNSPPALQIFYQGARPKLPASGDDTPEAGLEIYYRSPSFLLSAGGSFLNSGYGKDDNGLGGKLAWEETSRAQATTLIPTKIDTGFHDLIRFEPYPDPQINPWVDREEAKCYHTLGVNTGVSRGLAAGATLRPADKKTVLEQTTTDSPALASHRDQFDNEFMLVAWKGSGNDFVNVARAQSTTRLKVDGVEGVEFVVVPGMQTNKPLAIASHNGLVYLAWKHADSNDLSMAFSRDAGLTFSGHTFLGQTSEEGPALLSHAGRLYLAWTGQGNDRINVAKVVLIGSTAGDFRIGGVEEKVALGDASESAPTLTGHNGRLVLGWRGFGNNKLNVMVSADGGATFHAKTTFEEMSSQRPSLMSHSGTLFLAWKGASNNSLNVATLSLLGTTSTVATTPVSGMEIANKVILGETSESAPTLGSWNAAHRDQPEDRLLFLAWRGESKERLNLRVSRDGSFAPRSGWQFCNLEHLGFYLAIYKTPPAQPVSPPDDAPGRRCPVGQPRIHLRRGSWRCPGFRTV